MKFSSATIPKLMFLGILSLLAISSTALQSPLNPTTAASTIPGTLIESRRQMLTGLVASSLLLTGVSQQALALDMDAFVNSELASDTTNCDPKRDPKCIPKLTQDEALCKYGQSGQARADACKRVKSQGGQVNKATNEKSMGGAYAM